jgi:hypothetical protein
MTIDDVIIQSETEITIQNINNKAQHEIDRIHEEVAQAIERYNQAKSAGKIRERLIFH